MAANFGALANALCDLFSPRTCAACGGPRAGAPPFCITCGMPSLAEPLELDGVPVFVAGAYRAPLAPAIRRFKFEGRSELAPALAQLLAARLAVLPLKNPCFVPVPLHRARLVERGFNQSALIARHCARATGGSHAPRALERLKATEQQARLGREARQDNVLAAFRLRRPLGPSPVVLVDDVVTTGATVRACLAVLRAAGIEVAAIAALARADRTG